MTRFQRLPIRRKLVAMIMATVVIVLGVATAGYLVTDYYRARGDLQSALGTQAQMILENSRGALLYEVPSDADEVLASLSYNVSVRLGCMYDKKGALFSTYERNAALPCPESPPPLETRFDDNRLHLAVAPLVQDEFIGTVYLRSDLDRLQRRMRDQAAFVGILLLVALGIALMLSARLQSVVSNPVADLARTAADVSSRGDYSVRARKTTEDELGVLVDGFNRMLERIQLREGELSRANDDLRREIVERRRAEQERAELLVREREANRLKDEFLATLSHELRTPLNAILGWTKLLRTGTVPAAGLDRALEKIERNAQVQARLVEDLLEVSRIATGKLRLDIRALDLVTLVGTAIESIRQTAEARGVTVEREFADAALHTLGDPDRLQQVIWNLLSNAVKFTPAGGTVSVRVRRDGDDDELVVADTGIGIDQAFLPNVFDTFRQADASTTRMHGGLGLGLSIVRRLVEMHGGTVTAASAGANEGATFTVRLPVRAASTRVPPAPDGLGVDARLLGRTIVAVDDDEDTRDLLASVLETAGARVITAGSGPEGLAACLEHHPDILISDIAMPAQDGYTLVRQLQDALGPAKPRVTVALSAFAGERDRRQSADAGFDHHVAKPFEPVELVRTLGDLLAIAGTAQG